jgi:DNA replication protein DnaC
MALGNQFRIVSNEYNTIRNVRPDCRFSNFQIKHPSQEKAFQLFKGLTGQLIAFQGQLTARDNPLPAGKLIVLTGKPGRGKSHLMEALVNEIAEKAPDLYRTLFFGSMPLGYAVGYDPGRMNEQAFGGARIVLIDDLFREAATIDQVHSIDIKSLMGLISGIYEQRRLVIISSNFPFLGGLLEIIEKNDPTGRVISRSLEVLQANSGEILVDGPDYRAILAQEAQLGMRDKGGILGLGEPPGAQLAPLNSLT